MCHSVFVHLCIPRRRFATVFLSLPVFLVCVSLCLGLALSIMQQAYHRSAISLLGVLRFDTQFGKVIKLPLLLLPRVGNLASLRDVLASGAECVMFVI